MSMLTDTQEQLIRRVEASQAEHLAALRILAQHLDRGKGGREVALAITACRGANHWVQDAAWQLAGLDGEMRADGVYGE